MDEENDAINGRASDADDAGDESDARHFWSIAVAAATAETADDGVAATNVDEDGAGIPGNQLGGRRRSQGLARRRSLLGKKLPKAPLSSCKSSKNRGTKKEPSTSTKSRVFSSSISREASNLNQTTQLGGVGFISDTGFLVSSPDSSVSSMKSVSDHEKDPANSDDHEGDSTEDAKEMPGISPRIGLAIDSTSEGTASKPTAKSANKSGPGNVSMLVNAKSLFSKWRNKVAEQKPDPKPKVSLPEGNIQRARGSEIINPTVNGLRHFGIAKGGITRAVVKFSGPPESHPLTVCFHFPSTFLTHRYVLEMVKSKIVNVEGVRVTAIQFIDRNTLHGAQGLDNRWLVSLSSPLAKDILLRHGLHLFNRRILIRNYDDILMEEYREFMEYQQLQTKLYAQMKELMVGTQQQPQQQPDAASASVTTSDDTASVVSTTLSK